jgi:hypothetical protein
VERNAGGAPRPRPVIETAKCLLGSEPRFPFPNAPIRAPELPANFGSADATPGHQEHSTPLCDGVRDPWSLDHHSQLTVDSSRNLELFGRRAAGHTLKINLGPLLFPNPERISGTLN